MDVSSSYPWSTTACSRTFVMESLLANKVTSQPLATSPSAMLLATVSQAPYWRGGVRQATGARMATLRFEAISLGHGRQHVVQGNGGKAGGGIGQPVRND